MPHSIGPDDAPILAHQRTAQQFHRRIFGEGSLLDQAVMLFDRDWEQPDAGQRRSKGDGVPRCRACEGVASVIGYAW